MTASHSAGPEIVFGQLGDTTGTGSGGTNPEAGPSITYQGDCIPDVRQTYRTGITGIGKIVAHLDSPYLLVVDAVPKTYTTSGVATLAATKVAGSAFTLGSYSTTNGIYPGVPLVPFGLGFSTANVVSVLGLDVGFGTCTTNGTKTLSAITNGGYLQPGLTIAVAGGASNAWILATVLTVTGNPVTSCTLDTTISGSYSGAPLALANAQFDRNSSPVAILPYLAAGAALIFDPLQGITRGLQYVSASASDTAVTVTSKGYDIYGNTMTETVTLTGTAIVYGKKTFKYLASVTSGGATTVGIISVGTSDVFGIIVRSDKYEYLNAYWNGAFLSANTGWLAAVTTTATATTGNTRGSWQMSAIGGGSGASAQASNGVVRLALFMTLPLYNLVGATPQNPTPLYGVAQF